jgi:hypothetical protein
MLVGIGLISSVSHTLYRPYWYLLAGMVAANQRIAKDVVNAEADAAVPLTEKEFHPNSLYGALPASTGTYRK